MASTINIKRHGVVVILDDQDIIHQTWDSVFSVFIHQEHDIQVKHFSDPTALIDWHKEHHDPNNVYLIDYNLKTDIDGLDIIQQLGIEKQAWLVTGYSDDPDVTERCQKLNIRLIAKERAFGGPIEIIS